MNETEAWPEALMGKQHMDPKPVSAVPRELQMMWLSLLEGPWKSLAVVPTAPGASSQRVTRVLAEMLHVYPVGPCRIVDACGISPADGEKLAGELAASSAEGGLRTIVAADSLIHGLAGLKPVQAAEAAILVLALGSSLMWAEQTISLVGRDRVLGCLVVPAGW